MHSNISLYITIRLASLFCALVLFIACEKEDKPILWIHTAADLNYHVEQSGNTLQIPISSNSDWTVSSSADWISFDKVGGQGFASLQINIAPNKLPQIRQAVVSVALAEGEGVLMFEIKQNAASLLIGYPGIEKGAGYSYDVTADYCEGMKYQIFDIAYMDYRQMTDGKSLYVADDNTATVEEEFVCANTEEELSRQISVNCSIGLNVAEVFKIFGTQGVRLQKYPVCGRRHRYVIVGGIAGIGAAFGNRVYAYPLYLRVGELGVGVKIPYRFYLVPKEIDSARSSSSYGIYVYYLAPNRKLSNCLADSLVVVSIFRKQRL